MKPSLLAVLGLLMPVCAHAANNNIKMVTYFPIPYVSYNELGVTKTCDLGLMDGCVLDSGSSLLVHKTASDGALRLKEGTLSLNGPLVSGDAFRAGTDVISNSRIEFKHSVDVKSMTQSVQSLEVTNRAYLGELNLFGETFPKCDNNNSREMTWKRLTINGKEGVFLVCGAGEKQEHACPDSGVSGDARTWWDASVQKCGCPNAGEYYHNGACCSESTPKTDAKCWKKEVIDYAWMPLAGYRYESLYHSDQSCQCKLSGDRYGLICGWDLANVGLPSGLPSCASVGAGDFNAGEMQSSLIACTTPGQKCISFCSASCPNGMDNGGAAFLCMFSAGVKECAKSGMVNYKRLWNPKFDTRYGLSLPDEIIIGGAIE